MRQSLFRRNDQPAVTLPGPRLPKLLQTLLFFWRPVDFVERSRRRFGPNFRLDLAPFGEIAYVSDPDVVKQVFTGGADVYHAGEGNWVLRPLLGDRSVLVLDEDEHLQQRRLLLPPFHGEAVARYREVVREVTDSAVERWPLERPVAIRPLMQEITLEVIMRAVMGVREAERRNALRRLFPRMVDMRFSDLALFSASPRLFESRLGRSFGPLRVRDRVDEILYDEIRRRRSDGVRRDDVLSLLVAAKDEDGRGLTDVELRDQLVTLLLAGHETTATALAWAFERLARHSHALERLRSELDSGDGDEYLDAVCKETLRVRPVVMDVARKLTRDVEIAGGRVAAGALVMPSIALSHLAPASYDDPQAFRPERFLGTKPGTYTWFPFGGGPRRCIGAAFAVMEMKEVLRSALSRVELRTTDAPPERAKVKHVTLVPADGARVTLAPRSAPIDTRVRAARERAAPAPRPAPASP